MSELKELEVVTLTGTIVGIFGDSLAIEFVSEDGKGEVVTVNKCHALLAQKDEEGWANRYNALLDYLGSVPQNDLPDYVCQMVMHGLLERKEQ